ncbi:MULTISPECIES: hypothetical protein [Pseudomonas]|uniref:hypothetical protein n=1 Tax=Pseudomonas TaxID=286 RepID=UPI001C65E5C7|nr:MULTISPECIES: hypothetical protein [unclassified Pseudomonas]MBW8127927.1 hypothetical protein [Pseudomonas sp. LAP_36]MBW8137338.1 hypothetical protein [Pseudomonas sp. PAMC 26818]
MQDFLEQVSAVRCVAMAPRWNRPYQQIYISLNLIFSFVYSLNAYAGDESPGEKKGRKNGLKTPAMCFGITQILWCMD